MGWSEYGRDERKAIIQYIQGGAKNRNKKIEYSKNKLTDEMIESAEFRALCSTMLNGGIIFSEENCDMEKINDAIEAIDMAGGEVVAKKSNTNLKTQFMEFIAYEQGMCKETH